MRAPLVALSLLLGLVGDAATAFSPYNTPAAGWRYFLEAAHPGNLWPQCPARFLSFDASCEGLDLWSGARPEQNPRPALCGAHS